MKKQAFTIAEVLIVMLILTTVTLITAKIIPEKARLKKIPERHGTYACTRIGDQYYAFYDEKNKNATIPKVTSSGWKQVNSCGEGFTIPKVEFLGVTLIGGGGAGGKGEVETKTKSQINADLTESGYTIERSGEYEISLFSGQSEPAFLGAYREVGNTDDCYKGKTNVYYGKSLIIKRNLEKGQNVKIRVIPGTKSLKANFCVNLDKVPENIPGKHGDGVELYIDNKLVAKVTGGISPHWTCNANESGLDLFYEDGGSDGRIELGSGTPGSGAKSSGVIAKISLKKQNNNNEKTVNMPGCGGGAGEINVTTFPIKIDKPSSTQLPSMEIGLGGEYGAEDGGDGGETTFNAATALGGKAASVCQPEANAGLDNGIRGGSISSVTNMPSIGGAGGGSGEEDNINGQAGDGFGAGGGGGAAFSKNQWGTGGDGANGIIILTW